MGNDLIKRAAVVKAIHDFVEKHRNDNEIQWTGLDWMLKEDSVVEIINNLPAAYDVEKVVDRLETEGKYEDVPVFEGEPLPEPYHMDGGKMD